MAHRPSTKRFSTRSLPGKIDLNKWVELAKKFSVNNYKNNINTAWNTNSNFTLNISDKTVKFPDVTLYMKDGLSHGFFERFQGEIKINKDIGTSNVTSMKSMFYNTTKANPDVSKWNTSNVTVETRHPVITSSKIETAP